MRRLIIKGFLHSFRTLDVERQKNFLGRLFNYGYFHNQNYELSHDVLTLLYADDIEDGIIISVRLDLLTVAPHMIIELAR